MQLLALPAPLVLFPWNWNMAGYPTGTEATFVFDAVNDEFVLVVQCPPDAWTLDSISFNISVVTSAPSAGNITASVFAVSATTGEPTGAALASVNFTASTISIPGRYVISGLAYAWTAGTLYALSLKADASYVGNITLRYGSAGAAFAFPYGLTSNAGAAYAKVQARQGGFYFGLGTSTEGKKVLGLMGALSGDDTENISDAGNPDEVGNVFTFAQPMRVIGGVFYFSTGAGEVTTRLRDDTGSIQRTITVDNNQLQAANNRGVMQLFDSAFDTEANVAFELTASKSGFGGTMTIEYLDAPTNAELSQLWSSLIHGVTYNNAGGRADLTARFYGIFPIVSHIGAEPPPAMLVNNGGLIG